MSLLSNFIATHVVSLLEQELIKCEPHLQEVFITEVQEFSDVVGAWIKEKLSPKGE